MSTCPGPMPNDLAQVRPGSHSASVVHAVPTRSSAMSGVPVAGGGGVVFADPASGASGTDCVGDGGDVVPAGSPTFVPMTSNEQPAASNATTQKTARMPPPRAIAIPDEFASLS